MRTRIDYLADKYSFTELNESPRLRRQWQDVLEECRQAEAGPEERLRIALLNVDYVTSFELPFRLLLTRTPQLIAALREEWDISQKNVVFNDKQFGGFAPIFPDTCYHLTHYWPAAVDIPVASDNPVHYADAIRYNARTPLQGSLLPLTRLVWA